MGMTDDVICEFPLPEARHQNLRYQTITPDGRLMQAAKHSIPALARDMEWPLDAELEFHTSGRGTRVPHELVHAAGTRVDQLRRPLPGRQGAVDSEESAGSAGADART